jgi:hypothetical protein
MKREVLVDLESLNKVVKYLADRPYKEVVDLVEELRVSIREIPSDEEKTQPETERSKPKGFTNSK